MNGWRILLPCLLLAASACRGGVKGGRVPSADPGPAPAPAPAVAVAPAVASKPATERRRAEYYKISDG